MFLVRLSDHRSSATRPKRAIASLVLGSTGLPGEPRFWAAVGLSTCSVLAGASIAPGLVEIAYGIGASGAEWPKLLVSLPALAVPLGAFGYTRIAGRASPRQAARLAILIFAAFGVLGALVNAPAFMLGARFIQGLSIAPLMIIALNMLSGLDDVRGNMALQSVLMTSATVAILLVSGAVSQIAWQLPFALNLLPLVLLPTLIRHVPAERPVEKESKDSAEREGSGAKVHVFVSALILAFLAMACFYAIPTQAADFLNRSGYWGTGIPAALIVCSVLGAAIGGAALRHVGAGLGAGQALTLAFLVISVGHLQIGLGTVLPLMFVGAAIVGLGFGIAFPTLNHWAMTCGTAGLSANAAAAAITAAFHIGQFLSPLLALAAAGTDANPGKVFFPYLLLAVFAAVLAALRAGWLNVSGKIDGEGGEELPKAA